MSDEKTIHPILVDTLYTLVPHRGIIGDERKLEIIDGMVEVYGTHELPANPPEGMTKTATKFSGIVPFGNLPTYFYITQSDADVSTNLLVGVQPKPVE